ncbi:hypothetical protein [Bradyrhizobium mercantei]|nr:hypothetical protein [Bradyrhizobium mercantei]
MDQELGGFKVRLAGLVREVRQTIAQTVTNLCWKFSQDGSFAHKID